MHVNKVIFEHWGSLNVEHMESNILDWLYFDKKYDPMEFPKDKYVRLLPSLKIWDIMTLVWDLKKMESNNPLRLIAILKDIVWAPLNPRCPLLTTIV